MVQLLDPRLYRWRHFWCVFLVSRRMVVPASIAIFRCDERLCDHRTRIVNLAVRCGRDTALAAILFDTFVETSYLSARENATSLSYVLLIPVFWSIWTSYSLATATHHLKKWPGLGWFVLLPAVFYLVVFGFFAALFGGLIQA